MDTLTARMPNPATIIPEAMKPIQALFGSISGGGVPQATLDLVHLRVSQVNGCSACVASAAKSKQSAERLERIAGGIGNHRATVTRWLPIRQSSVAGADGRGPGPFGTYFGPNGPGACRADLSVRRA